MDYSQHAAWFYRHQGEIYEPTADSGHERLGSYGITSPDSYGQRHPTVRHHMVNGLEDFRPKPRWSSQYNYWAHVPVTSMYSDHPQERPGRAIYHPTHGGPPWLGVLTEASGYLSQPVRSRPRTQYHPRPRSARFQACESYVPGHGYPRFRTNVYGLGTHAEPGSGGVPRRQKDIFMTNPTPRSQRDRYYGTCVDQDTNERFVSQQDSMPQADHGQGLSPGHYGNRWTYSPPSPAHPHTGDRAYYGVPDPAFISPAAVTGRHCGYKNHGISDKNHGTPLPEQRKPYQRPDPNTRANRTFATETAPNGWQRAAVTSEENNPPGPQSIHPPHSRPERVRRSHPKIPLNPSNTAAAPPPAGNASSPPAARRFEPFYSGHPTEQRRRQSESSTDSDTVDGCFATHNSHQTRESTYPTLPHRTRSIKRQVRQELHRCALAAAALQLEKSKLRREWKKLRREQETLLHGQRRLRHDRHAWTEAQQQPPLRSESTDPRNETDSSSDTESLDPPPHSRTEDSRPSHHPRPPPPAPSPTPTPHSPTQLLAQYNHRWTLLLLHPTTTTPTPRIPFPTPDLLAPTLFTRPPILFTTANPLDVPKWNAFTFFTSAFGCRAAVTQTPSGLVMGIGRNTSLEVLKAMRDQAREDVKRWHQDRLKLVRGREGEWSADGDEGEGAKAVFAAVLGLYGVCGERIRAG